MPPAIAITSRPPRGYEIFTGLGVTLDRATGILEITGAPAFGALLGRPSVAKGASAKLCDHSLLEGSEYVRTLEEAIDIELAVGARAGCRRSFEELIRRYRPAALRLAYQICGDANEASDATQDASLFAYRAIHGFRDGFEFRPWFMRIVRNAALARIEAQQRRSALAERALHWFVTPTIESPESELLAAERARELHLALAHLRPSERRILQLRWFEGLSEAEIAAALEIPRGTVKSRLSRARGRLQDAISLGNLVDPGAAA